MQKKIFLRRKGKGATSYLKYMVIAAVSVIVILIVTPYLLKNKSIETTKRPIPGKGAITKEIPKQAVQPAPERLVETAKPASQVAPPETTAPGPGAPAPIKPPEVRPAPEPSEPGPAASQKPAAERSPEIKPSAPEKSTLAKSPESAQPGPKDLFPKKRTPAEAPSTATLKKPAGPEEKPRGAKPALADKQAPAAKPAPPAEGGGYAVQVGATFTDRSQARQLIKDLAAKGYKAVIRTAADGWGYFVTTGPCPQSKAYTLQEQMKIQGISGTKVIKF